METTTEIQTYDIQVGVFGWLENEIEKLNRKAKRLGCPEAKINVIREFLKPHSGLARDLVLVDCPTFKGYGRQLAENWVPHYKHYEISIECEPIKEAGWELLGCLDRIVPPDGEAYTALRPVPGKHIPERYRTTDQCEHCSVTRQRKTTYIVEHEDGRIKQVGSTCLQDFLGYDPVRLVWAANFNSKVTGIIDHALAPDSNAIRQAVVYPAHELLAVVSASITRDGWLSRKQAYDKGYEGGATADHATFDYLVRTGQIKCSRQDYTPLTITDEDKALAKASIEWGKTISENESNEYLYSLRQVCTTGWIDQGTLGVGCSLINAYQRAQAQEIKRREKALAVKDSEYLGEIKVRFEITVKCLTVRSYESEWGVTRQHQLVTPDGDSVIWWASGGTESLREGSTYLVKATPKKHEEYNGTKQTTVTRVKIVKQITEGE